jgi:hypothetical protein
LDEAFDAAVSGQSGQDLGLEPLADMEDLFFAIQLYSYRGDYLTERPRIERVAETLDKLEEDLLEQPYPTVRGKRRVVVRFGPPLPVPQPRDKRRQIGELTMQLQQAVQQQLDHLAARPPERDFY